MRLVYLSLQDYIKYVPKIKILPKICDFYVEYLLILVENQMDISVAKEEVEKYFKAVNKDLEMPANYLLYVMASKARVKLILKQFDDCLKMLRKVLKFFRKFKDQLVNQFID